MNIKLYNKTAMFYVEEESIVKLQTHFWKFLI